MNIHLIFLEDCCSKVRSVVVLCLSWWCFLDDFFSFQQEAVPCVRQESAKRGTSEILSRHNLTIISPTMNGRKLPETGKLHDLITTTSEHRLLDRELDTQAQFLQGWRNRIVSNSLKERKDTQARVGVSRVLQELQVIGKKLFKHLAACFLVREQQLQQHLNGHRIWPAEKSIPTCKCLKKLFFEEKMKWKRQNNVSIRSINFAYAIRPLCCHSVGDTELYAKQLGVIYLQQIKVPMRACCSCSALSLRHTWVRGRRIKRGPEWEAQFIYCVADSSLILIVRREMPVGQSRSRYRFQFMSGGITHC